MIEMQGFLEKFVQKKREKGTDWLLGVFGTGSERCLQRKRPLQASEPRDRRKKLGLPRKMSNKLSTLAAAEIRVPADLISGQLNAN